MRCDKRLYVEGLEFKNRMAERSLQIVLHLIQADFMIKTPHQDDSLLLKSFQYAIKSYRNTTFFLNIANILKTQNSRAEI